MSIKRSLLALIIISVMYTVCDNYAPINVITAIKAILIQNDRVAT